MPRVETIASMLSRADELRWNHALFVKRGEEWTADTPCAVLDPNDSPGPDQDPDFAVLNDLTYALDVQAVKSVLNNIALPNPGVDLDRLVAALRFYYENDAFLET